MNPSTSAAVTPWTGLPTTVKKTFRSNLAASTEFARHRAAKNSRYNRSSREIVESSRPILRAISRTP